jgi:hypothetical protein
MALRKILHVKRVHGRTNAEQIEVFTEEVNALERRLREHCAANGIPIRHRGTHREIESFVELATRDKVNTGARCLRDSLLRICDGSRTYVVEPFDHFTNYLTYPGGASLWMQPRAPDDLFTDAERQRWALDIEALLLLKAIVNEDNYGRLVIDCDGNCWFWL